MPNRTTTKGENTRQLIVEAGYRLFLQHGYSATPMRDIARQAGLTVGGVYTHYSSKEEIFRAVLVTYHPFLKILPALLEAEGETVEELLRCAAHRMVALLGSEREALNLMFVEIVEFQGAHLSDLMPVLLPPILGLIEKIQKARGSLRPEMNPLVLARSFFGLFFSYFMTQTALAPLARQMPDALDSFVDIYLYGILTGPEPEPAGDTGALT